MPTFVKRCRRGGGWLQHAQGERGAAAATTPVQAAVGYLFVVVLFVEANDEADVALEKVVCVVFRAQRVIAFRRAAANVMRSSKGHEQAMRQPIQVAILYLLVVLVLLLVAAAAAAAQTEWMGEESEERVGRGVAGGVLGGAPS